ncbi:hypothetical protein NDU88_003774 [Pleurodeles waltl]|uniref:Uncharacterized protein n=1 Tax=Pleurodeles waltl TaxID=8319 RepID=A0AAV7RE31_PLEWA|nr:hypothetical protein NDU88_003774 [Pleurodeles waltl]
MAQQWLCAHHRFSLNAQLHGHAPQRSNTGLRIRVSTLNPAICGSGSDTLQHFRFWFTRSRAEQRGSSSGSGSGPAENSLLATGVLHQHGPARAVGPGSCQQQPQPAAVSVGVAVWQQPAVCTEACTEELRGSVLSPLRTPDEAVRSRVQLAVGHRRGLQIMVAKEKKRGTPFKDGIPGVQSRTGQAQGISYRPTTPGAARDMTPSTSKRQASR